MASLENKYGKSAVDATRRNALPPYLDTLFEGGIGGGAGVETHSITLTTANWSNLQQNVVLTCGATNASDIVCAGDNSTMDADYYLSAFGVKLTSASVVEGEEEGVNTATFTFTAASMPTTNINVVIVIVNASTEGGVPVATISRVGVVKPDGTTISIDSNGTIHSIGGGGGGGSSSPSRVLLWTNPSTSTPFPAQNVLSASQISAYTSFEIEVRNYIAENIYNICKITKDSPRQVWAFDTSTMGANSGVPAITNRQVIIDSNGLSFEIGYSKTTTNSGRAGSTPDVCIPCRIWGIVDSGGTSSITYFESQTTSVASNAEILRITDSAITTNTIVLECTFANPSAISGDVSWTSYNGYISFIGTCTSATTANVTLADKTN